ncbi:MAG: peptidyl-tRNA hydrolase Pth2 [Halobacteriota archaeon]|nr:peptidyl-tRNA hydrolase Pth2 [Halobacteriota archaeon]
MMINRRSKVPEYKQCIVVRSDLNLSKGKCAVQASHASILAYNLAKRSDKSNWLGSGQKKVALKVETKEELISLKGDADRMGLPCAIVVDAGLTEIPPGTVTSIGIGPSRSDLLDKITSGLKLL